MINILIIFLILLVWSTKVTNGLSCIGENIIGTSFNKLTHGEFQKTFNELIPYDVIACDILITVDYASHQLTVELDTTLASVTDADIRDAATLYTTFTRTSDEGRCDEKFLSNDDHYQWWWLIDEANHTGIEGMFNQLFTKDKSTTGVIRCCEKSTSEYCDSEFCLVQSEYILGYTSQFDIFNERSIFLQTRNITYIHYNMSPMLRISTRKLTKGPNTTTVVTQFNSIYNPMKSSPTTVSVQISATVAARKSSSTFVLIVSTTESGNW